MPVYQYIAKRLDGRTARGEEEAPNKKELAQILKSKGCFLVTANLQKNKLSLGRFIPKIKYIPISQKLLVTQNLQVLIAAGVSLPRSLEVLQKQVQSRYFKNILTEARALILKGSSLSDSLANFPNVFPDIYISLIRVGEKTGNLEGVLKILTDQLDRSYQLRSKIRGAMLYPSVIVSTMVLIGVVMMIKVIPQLSQTFEELQVELPVVTKVVIAIGNFFVNYWLLALIILAVFLFSVFLFLKTKIGKRVTHSLFLKLPILGPLTKKINAAFTAMSLSALVQGGVPIVSAISIASDSVSNYHFKKALKQVARKVEKGNKLSKAVAKYEDLYSPLFVQMLQVGEETGATSEMLLKLSEFYEDQVNNTTKNLSSIIEPVLLLLIGLAVGVFAVSVMQPIYSIMSSM